MALYEQIVDQKTWEFLFRGQRKEEGRQEKIFDDATD